MKLRIGNLDLDSNLILAPLAGWTSLAFRLVVRAVGGMGLAMTEVVSAKALLKKSRKTLELLETDPADRPLSVQINASCPEEARDAALFLEARGFDAVDFNLGCPVKKIAQNGCGAALARDPAAAAAVIGAAARAVKIPVTAKMRLGWEKGELTAPDLAKALVQAGVAAVAVHGRTRAQGFQGDVDRKGIAAVVKAVPEIPVFANGDIDTVWAAASMLQQTGAAGLLIGRAAITNPWIFQQIRDHLDYFAGLREDAEHTPSLEERLRACERHFYNLSRGLPDHVAAHRFRKVLRAWGQAIGAGEEFWRRAAAINGGADVQRLLDDVREAEEDRRRAAARGLLPPEAFGGHGGDWSVPVPAGPVDVW